MGSRKGRCAGRPDRNFGGRLTPRLGEMSRRRRPVAAPGVLAAARTQGKRPQHGKPQSVVRDDQPDAREGEAGRRCGVAERIVLPLKPGTAGGGKGPQFKTDARRSEGPGDWATYHLRTAFRNCRRRCTRKRRQELGYRLLCPLRQDRSREDLFWRRMPMPSAAPTRARRAWTVEDFEAVEAYGVERWLGELALALEAGDLPTGPYPDACTYLRPTANSGRWASQPCGIGSE